MKKETFKIDLGEKKIEIEINDLVEQASGSCFVRCGDTKILITATFSKRERQGIDFLPLSVEYQEKYYATGKILGSRYMRREGKPSDEAILTARVIDRTIRPLFSDKIRKDIQVVAACLSWDSENDPDILALLGASISIITSDIPWDGPIGACRVSQLNEKFILNPTYEEREESNLDLILSGVMKDNDILINMIEGDSKQVSEETILNAIDFAKPFLKKMIESQEQIREKLGKKKLELEEAPKDRELEEQLEKFLENKIENVLLEKDKLRRDAKQEELKQELIIFIKEKYSKDEVGDKVKYSLNVIEAKFKKLICENVLLKEQRVDGRKLDELRELYSEVDILPRTHGSSLFCRGKTKSMSILTLGGPSDARLLEGMEITTKKKFMHHYNFPPYSVGETSPFRFTGRREIGHGMLAEKALSPILPNIEDFPYTIRIVSEMLSSNGSTSMASVCSSSLCLMDAGVPIERPVAGIAIGLIFKDKDNYKVLTDIQGPEDHYGHMDFKITGTDKGITAIQLDVKTKGLNNEIIKEALSRGKKARLEILEQIKKTIPEPRTNLSKWAPQIDIIEINPEKIREVIGPKGKMINEIIDTCNVSIDIEDSGKIFITSEDKDSSEKAIKWIRSIVKEVEVGEIFQGKVSRIMDFGAFVEILPNQEGLVHISELDDQRVDKVEDILKIGDIIPVKVILIDDLGRINLSLKQAKK